MMVSEDLNFLQYMVYGKIPKGGLRSMSCSFIVNVVSSWLRM